MTQSFQVLLGGGKYIGVSDDSAGWKRLEEFYRTYGNLTVRVFDRNDVFGKGYENATPMITMKLLKLLEEG